MHTYKTITHTNKQTHTHVDTCTSRLLPCFSVSVGESITEQRSEAESPMEKITDRKSEEITETTDGGLDRGVQVYEGAIAEVDREREASFSIGDLVRILGSEKSTCRAAVLSLLQKIRTNQITPIRVAKDDGKTEELFNAKELLQVLCILPGLAGQQTPSETEIGIAYYQQARNLAGVVDGGEHLSAKKLLEAVDVVCSVIDARDKTQTVGFTGESRRRMSDVYKYLEHLQRLTSAIPASTDYR